MRTFLRLQIYLLAAFILLASCTAPTSTGVVRDYDDMEIPPFLAPLPPILLTIDGLEDLYLGRNTKTAEYVAIELRKTSGGSQALFMGQGVDFNQAIKRMILVRNVEIYSHTIYEDRGIFQAVQGGTSEWTFVLNAGWGSFDMYFRTDPHASFSQVYRFNDPYNPYLHGWFWS